MTDDNYEYIYIPDYMAVICIFYENKNYSINELHRNYDISYTSLHKMKKMFTNKNLVTITKDGAKHIVTPTEKGEAIVKAVYIIIDTLGITREEFFSLKLGRKERENGKEKNKTGNKKEDRDTGTKETDTNGKSETIGIDATTDSTGATTIGTGETAGAGGFRSLEEEN